MRWVISPFFDCFWLLSGVPIGIVLMLTCPGMVPPLAIAIMVLESAHVVSPMLLAWTQPQLRRIVSREWGKHIALPAAVMAGSFVIPVAWVFPLYWTWNIYHFGMQNFGIASLYGVGHDRTLRALICVGLTTLGMGVLPFVIQGPHLAMLSLGIFSFSHWLADIGLSSRLVRWHWGFVSLVLAAGFAWLLLRQGPLSVRLVPQIIVIRYGIGMIHFVYSARIWKLSDPQVRAMIGKELLA